MSEIKLVVDTPEKLTEKLNNFVNDVNLNLPTDELEDFTELFFSGIETYEKAMADGTITIEDAFLLNKVTFALFAAFSGANMSLAQALDLTDTEILAQVKLGDNYQLGSNADKYKQTWKELLYKFQTYSVFTK